MNILFPLYYLLLASFASIILVINAQASHQFPFSSSISYSHHLRVLNSNGNPLDFFWAVSGATGSKRFHFAIGINNPNINWIGIGINEPAATMPGADIGVATFGSAANQGITFRDYFARGFETPIPDPEGDKCVSNTLFSSSSTASSATSPQQGWKSVGGFKNSTHTMIEGYREFLAVDPRHDRSLSENEADVSRFIFALGPTSQLSYHGDNAWQCRVRLFSTTAHLMGVAEPPQKNPLVDSGHPYYFVGFGAGHVIQPRVTHYIESPCVAVEFSGSIESGTAGVVTGQSNISAPAYIIGFMSQIHPATAKFVHHLVLKGHNSATCDRSSGISSDVAGFGYDPESYYEFPPDVALNIARFRGITIQFHYHNPSLETGYTDFSGIRMYYQTTPRTHSASILQIGDPVIQTRPSTIPMGVTTYNYECGSTCTNLFPRSITVFGAFQHMHSNGVMFENKFYRQSATEPYFTAKAEYYDYHDQRFFNFREPITIMRGDRLQTRCTYKTLITGKVFGMGSDEEMCISFLYYYEDLPSSLIIGQYCGVSVCGTQGAIETVSSETELDREYGTGVCSAGQIESLFIFVILVCVSLLF
jgi:hypothetical protein